MLPDPSNVQEVALDLKQHQGISKILRFLDLGGTITPPSDDPQDWWEPETLTHRADFLGLCKSGSDGFAALTAWITTAEKVPHGSVATQQNPPTPTEAA